MRPQGVKRLISVTGFGAGDSRASINCHQLLPFRFFFGRAYDDKDVQERLIKDSALDWTIVRPGLLTNGGRTGRYTLLNPVRLRLRIAGCAHRRPTRAMRYWSRQSDPTAQKVRPSAEPEIRWPAG